MKYVSLFDLIATLYPNWRDGEKLLPYTGSLDDILSELEKILTTKGPQDLLEDYTVRALHPPRIIRAAIDYKIEATHIAHTEELVREAINLALAVYTGSPSAASALNDFRSHILETGNSALLTRVITQPDDMVTWSATHPELSEETTNKILSSAESKDVLFISLAHGGVAAGLDVYLRYCALSKSTNSEFYVARFSRAKSHDLQPRITEGEISYLQQLARGRQVIIFDEDMSTGKTLKAKDIDAFLEEL